jgi:mannose-1-phosphate guanylyltransferase
LKALLLAAGFGTRLRPITDHTPKCLVEINGRPLLSYWFDLISRSGVEEVLVNTHYLPQKVKYFIENSSYKSKVTIIYEEKLLGTGGTIRRNREFFSNDSFLVAHADNLTSFNLDEFIAVHIHRQPQIEVTMMTFDTDAPQSCGIVETDVNNIVVGFHEKVNTPPSNKANAAVYIFEPTIFEFLEKFPSDTIDISTEVLPFFMGKMQTYHNSVYHRDIGTVESLKLANEEFHKLSLANKLAKE